MANAAQKPPRMTVEEALAWEEGREERYELHDGLLVSMQADRLEHNLVKFNAAKALDRALLKAGSGCRAWIDGVAVRIDRHTKYLPDAAVACGPQEMGESWLASPVVIVEVDSPATSRIDAGMKLRDYFRLSSVTHYLQIFPKARLVIHHRRTPEGILARFLTEGALRLDPPGVGLEIAELFEGLPPPEAPPESEET